MSSVASYKAYTWVGLWLSRWLILCLATCGLHIDILDAEIDVLASVQVAAVLRLYSTPASPAFNQTTEITGLARPRSRGECNYATHLGIPPRISVARWRLPSRLLSCFPSRATVSPCCPPNKPAGFTKPLGLNYVATSGILRSWDAET